MNLAEYGADLYEKGEMSPPSKNKTFKEQLTKKVEEFLAEKRRKDEEALEKKLVEYRSQVNRMTNNIKSLTLSNIAAAGGRYYNIGPFSLYPYSSVAQAYPNVGDDYLSVRDMLGRTGQERKDNIGRHQDSVKERMTGAMKEVYDFWVAEGFDPVIDYYWVAEGLDPVIDYYWAEEDDEGFNIVLNW